MPGLGQDWNGSAEGAVEILSHVKEPKQAANALRKDEDKKSFIAFLFKLRTTTGESSQFREELLSQGGLDVGTACLGCLTGAQQAEVLKLITILLNCENGMDQFTEEHMLVERVYNMLKGDANKAKQVLEILIVTVGATKEGRDLVYEAAKKVIKGEQPYAVLVPLLDAPDLNVIANVLAFLNTLVTKYKSSEQREVANELVSLWKKCGLLKGMQPLSDIEDREIKDQLMVFQKLTGHVIPLGWYAAEQYKQRAEELQQRQQEALTALQRLQTLQPKAQLVESELQMVQQSFEELKTFLSTEDVAKLKSKTIEPPNWDADMGAYSQKIFKDFAATDEFKVDMMQAVKEAVGKEVSWKKFQDTGNAIFGDIDSESDLDSEPERKVKINIMRPGYGSDTSSSDGDSFSSGTGSGSGSDSDTDEDVPPPEGPDTDDEDVPPPGEGTGTPGVLTGGGDASFVDPNAGQGGVSVAPPVPGAAPSAGGVAPPPPGVPPPPGAGGAPAAPAAPAVPGAPPAPGGRPAAPPPPVAKRPGPPPKPGAKRAKGPKELKLNFYTGELPKKKMRVMHWEKYALYEGTTSMWHKVHKELGGGLDCKFDQEEFEDMFSQKEKTHKEAAVKKEVITLIDGKKFQNISIMMHKMPTVPEIQRAVQQLDNSVLDRDKLDALVSQVPTEEEIAEFTNNMDKKPQEEFESPELFYQMVITSICFTKRCKSWMLTFDWDEIVATALRPIGKIQRACDSILQSQHLPMVMGLVLGFGNYMNEGSLKGNAPGFAVSTLTKLEMTKDVSGKVNLLQYLVYAVKEKDFEALQLPDELEACLDGVQGIKNSDLEDGLKNVTNALKVFTHNTKAVEKALSAAGVSTEEDPFVPKMQAFYQQAEKDKDIVEKKFESAQQAFVQVLDYWSAKRQANKMPDPDELFCNLCPFLEKFQSEASVILKEKKRLEKAGNALKGFKSSDGIEDIANSIKQDMVQS